MTSPESTNRELLDVLQKHVFVTEQCFDRLTRRLEDMDQRFDRIDERFDRVDERFNQVDQQFKQVDQRFGQVDQRFNQVDERFSQVDQQFKQVDEQFKELTEIIQGLASHLDREIQTVRSEMATKADLERFVTKDYFDEKLVDLRGDLVVMARKSNKKLEALVEELVAEKRLHTIAARKILLLEPFPQA